MFSISKDIVEYNRIISEGYIKFINIVLIIKFLVSLIYNLFIIFKVEYNKSILSFKIDFIITIHVILLVINKIKIKIRRD